MPCNGCGGESIQDVMAEIAPGAGLAPPQPQRFRWRSICPACESRLDQVLRSWEGTPYMAGQRARGMGVDCVQAIVGVLDDLFRRPVPTPVPRLSPDTAQHNVRSAMRTIRAIRAGFASYVVRDGTIEPGDGIVVKVGHHPSSPRRPGHVIIVGAHRNEAWDAQKGRGFGRVSLSGAGEVIRVYRFLNKEQWA